MKKNKEYEHFDSWDSLIDSVIKWGEVRGIDNVKAQALCWAEEVGEVFSEINHDRFGDEYEDGLGDALVCEIILAHITNKSLFKSLEKAYNEIKYRGGSTKDGHFIKDDRW